MQKSSSQWREALNARTFTLRFTGKQAAWGFAESSSHCIGGKKNMFLFLHLQFMLPQFTGKRDFNYLLTKIRHHFSLLLHAMAIGLLGKC